MSCASGIMGIPQKINTTACVFMVILWFCGLLLDLLGEHFFVYMVFSYTADIVNVIT